jgi:uncharacterized protein YjdB
MLMIYNRINRKALLLLFVSVVAISRLMAQTVEHGRESAKGDMNFTDVANYYLAHPEPFALLPLQNEDDDIPRPAHPPADSSMIHTRSYRHTPYSPPGPLLPVSPSPTDTFESTLDPGTAIPPDTHGAVDTNYCMTTINTTVKIQTRAGGAVSSVSLNSFFSSINPANGTFDPRVHYDPYSNRWMVICVSGANNVSDSTSILIAVSKTSNPTGAWWMYRIRAYTPHTYWLDYPVVGFNGKWITVTGNLFQNSPGTGYNGAKVFVFDKASLYAGSGAPYTAFTQSTSFTISPALTYSSTEPSMFAIEVYNAGAGLMHLWKITGAVGSETMTAVGLPASSAPWQASSFQYTGTTGADFAPQAGTSNKIQTNDDRVTQLVLMNNNLWFAHTVFLPYSSSVNATHSSIDWWEVDTLANPIQIGRIDDPTATNFYAFPSMAVNTSNDALIGFSAFSASTYASAAYALRMNTDPTDSVRPLQVYRHGQASYYKTFSGADNRWGDYSGTVLDPVNQTDFWTIQEAAASPSNTWDTWWANVKLCSPPPAITGTFSLCAGATTSLTDATTGGTWTSSNTAVATIGSSSATVSGVGAGTTIITYTVAGGCTVTATVTVNPLPAAITGATSVCTGSATNLTDAGGGTWSSSNTSVATVTAGGVVTGVANGTSVITYTLPTGCLITSTMTVNAVPGPITGATTVCAGATTNLTDAGGGTWASSNTAVATATASGVITGVAAGTTIITYSLGAGCSVTTVVTVNASPAAISGTASVCTGLTTSLSDGVAGGVWTSGNTAIATVAAGTVGGVAAGTATISYALGSCVAARVVTVNASPTAILGTTTVCEGTTTSLSDAVPGGTWSSSFTPVATVSGTGLVSAVGAGTSTIVYTTTGGCSISAILTVNITPAAISGTASVCAGQTTSLSDITGGGAWGSSNTAVATVAGGTVGGVAAGTATIAYTLGSCAASVVVTVNPIPGAISGTAVLCSGATTSLSDGVAGGTWSSGSAGIATVSATGIVTGVTAGTANITYSIASSCIAIKIVTVNQAPAAISGTTSLCVGGTTSLSDVIGGGTWVSSNTSVATIGTSGTVTGVTIGTSTISYTLATGCNTSTVITVTPATGSPITGAGPVCVGQTLALSDVIAGGAWTSANTSVATISTSGVVTGVSAGTTTISYAVFTGCGVAVVTAVVTVNANPVVLPITGGLTFCSTAGTTLSDATPSGVWSSGNTAVATAAATGVISGVSAGAAAISYTVTNGAGCTASSITTVTVTAPPVPVVTPASSTTFCTGGFVTLNSSTRSGATYQWRVGGVNIPGATSVSYVANTSGTYDIVMNSGSGCLGTSFPVTVTVNPSAIVTPSVSITASPGTSLCATASSVSFAPVPVNGGATPSYQWYVNGVPSSTGTTFSYTPANGDVVKVLMASSDVCAFPDTAKASVTMTITPAQTPGVTIVPTPRDTVCTGSPVTLLPVPVYGGSLPVYSWSVNGSFAHSGSTYSYVPANGDVVVVTMTSNYFCLTASTAISPALTLHTEGATTNTVSILVTDSTIISGRADTFVAVAPAGGPTPSFQWYINSTAVPGATSNIFITSSLVTGDVVTCKVVTSDPCATPTTAISNGITIIVIPSGVQTLTSGMRAFTLMPNPNGGTFTVRGTLNNIAEDRVDIRVTNMLGQTIYTKAIRPRGGDVNERITLPGNIVSGMYLVNIIAGGEHATFHVAVEK